MRFLRLIVAGLVAIAAMLMVFLAAMVVFFTGLAAYVLQLFRGRRGAAPSSPAPAPNRAPASRRTDDVIDVVATKVPEETAKR
jgi:hypothetical protein